MMTRLFRLVAALAAPLALAGAAHADNEQYSYDPSYQEGPPALILYSGPNFSGEAREIYDPIYALPQLTFNDRASSVAVLSGQWEVCEHSDFTGRCVFLRYDVPDLAWYGLSNRVSSVRPVYEYTEAEHGLMFIRDRNGYIRYVDNERYGYDSYRYGYGVTTGIEVYHYGYSPDYRRYGYYDPRLGYDPYGFGWNSGYSGAYYGSSYYRRERPPLRGHYGARDGAVTLYVDSYGRGASFGLNRSVSDLSRYRFNDNISSLSIRSGRWEVCTDANFRGTCRIVDASVDKLNGLRLNDNISSIRRLDSTGHDRWDRWDRGDRAGDRDRDRDRDGTRDRDRRDRRDGSGERFSGGVTPAPSGVRKGGRPGVRGGYTPPGTTPPATRRSGVDRAPDRRPEPALAGGTGTAPPAVRRIDRDRSARSEPRTGTPRTPMPSRVTRAPVPAGTPTPVAPSTRRSMTPSPAVRTPQAQPRRATPERLSRPGTRPASPPPRAAPQRDTRSPALLSRGRPTRDQD